MARRRRRRRHYGEAKDSLWNNPLFLLAIAVGAYAAYNAVSSFVSQQVTAAKQSAVSSAMDKAMGLD